MIESKKKKSNPKPKTKTNPTWGWRPSVVTESVLAKLEYGFSKGLTDLESCLYANISKDALYNYIQRNPSFSDRKEMLKLQPKMKAKLVIADKIDEADDYNSRWYLERKWKDEFSTKVENDNTNVNTEVESDSMTPEQRKLIADRFKG